MSFRDGKTSAWFYTPDPVTGNGWPVETPGKNGPYAGNVPVRVIPPGVSGLELKEIEMKHDFAGDGRFKTAHQYRQSAALKSKQRRRLK